MEIIDFRRFSANVKKKKKEKNLVIKHFVFKSKFQRSPINTLEIKANSLKQKHRVAKDLWAQKKGREGRQGMK